jgi:hypothetical protein
MHCDTLESVTTGNPSIALVVKIERMDIGAQKSRWLTKTLIFALVSAAPAQEFQYTTPRYSAAALTSDGFGVNTRLMIFPADRKEFSIAIPLALGYVTYGASGESLYASAFKRLDTKTVTQLPGLFKIEINPVRVKLLPRSDAFYLSGHFAVSQREDSILFAGVRTDTGDNHSCGIFELNLKDGNLRPILESKDCGAGSPWRVFDLAPSGLEGLIRAERQLALLDLANRKIAPLGSDLLRGSYSPDGKWIAALELAQPGRSSTVIIDRKDFSHRRNLGGSEDEELVWSPDSQFLLHAEYRPACPSQNALALATLDIETGKRITLKSTICNVGSGREIGWIDGKIGK